MLNLVEVVTTLKSHIYYGDISYESILDRCRVPKHIGLFVAKSILIKDGYTFTRSNGGSVVDILNLHSIDGNIYVKAPLRKIVELFGFQSACDVIDPTSPAWYILNHIANMGIQGCTTVEISQFKEVKNVHVVIDKLVATGVITKRMVIPYGNSNQSRIKTVSSIFHLKKFSAFYNPMNDNIQILPDEKTKDTVYEYITEVLDSHDIQYLSSMDFTRYFNINKRQGQYIRNQIAMQHKQGYCILNAEEKKTAPLKSNLEPGLLRTVWCICKSHYPTPQDCDQATTRIRNLPLIEQIDLYTRRRKGFSVGDIRKFTSTSRKRAQKLMDAMTSSFQYKTIRVQEGRVSHNRLIPKPGSEFPEVHESMETGDMMNPSLSAGDTPLANKSNSSLGNDSRNKRGLEDITVATKEMMEELKQSVSKENVKRRFSLEQEERLSTIINYLHKQEFGVGSVLEASRLLRMLNKQKEATSNIDKKTVSRMVEKLESQGLIELRTMDLDEGHSKNFGVKQVVLTILNDFPGDVDSRISNYLDSYVHLKYRKNVEELGASLVQDSSTRILAAEEPINTIDLDELLRESGAIEEPKLKRTRRSRVKHSSDCGEINRIDDKGVRCDSPEQIHTLPTAPSESIHKDFRSIIAIPENEIEGMVYQISNASHTENANLENVQHEVIESKVKGKSAKIRVDWDAQWTPTEDTIALGHFVDNFFVRKARQGLPNALKPAKLKKLSGVKSKYVIYPWASVSDCAMLLQDISTLRSYYMTNTAMEVLRHSVAASKRRVPSLVKKFSSLAELIATYLWETNGDVGNQTYKAVEFVLKRMPAINEDHETIQKIIGSIFKMIGRADGVFELSELLHNQEGYDKDVIKVLREFYMHCIIRSHCLSEAGQENEIKHKFAFAKPFLYAALDRPLGGFISQNVTQEFGEIEDLSDLQNFLLFVHTIPSIRKQPTLMSPDRRLYGAEITVLGDNIADGTCICSDRRTEIGNKELTTPFRLSTHESSEYQDAKSIDRVSVEVAYIPTLLFDSVIFTGSEPTIAANDFQRQLPWFDVEGALDRTTFQYYATQVATFLTEYPQSTMSQIHLKLGFLPAMYVEELVKSLVVEKILKVRVVESSMVVIDPFKTSKQLKDSRNRGRSAPTEKFFYYSLNI